MSIQFVTTTLLTTQTVDHAGKIHVTKDGSILVNTALDSGIKSAFSNSDDSSVFIEGTVSTDHYGISITGEFDDRGDHRIRIGETGVVDSQYIAVYVAGSYSHVSNFGRISAENNAVKFGDAYELSLTNHGSIIGGQGGSYMGVQFYSPSSGFFADDARVVVNTGIISGESGVVSSRARLDITNSGEIRGTNGAAIASGDSLGSTVLNSGLLAGGGVGTAISLGTGDDQIFNTGVIDGDVLMAAGDDTYDGRDGRVLGAVLGGDGDDTYYVSDRRTDLQEASSEGVDLVNSEGSWRLAAHFENLTLIGDANSRGFGNGLDNVMTGNMSDNRLRGRNGDDVLNGEEGDDRLFGGRDEDTLNGGEGNDLLKGGRARDRLYGEEGDDRLFGGSYKDRLYGGDGEDRLVGGRGKDELYGGDDADVFVFRKISDSANTTDFDTIHDFEVNLDIIDLSKLPGDMTYIGSSAFSNTAGEVRVTTPGADSVIKIDIDGDGSADMKIFVVGISSITADDFLL